MSALGLTWEQVAARSLQTSPSGLTIYCADCRMQFDDSGVPCLRHTLPSEHEQRDGIVAQRLSALFELAGIQL